MRPKDDTQHTLAATGVESAIQQKVASILKTQPDRFAKVNDADDWATLLGEPVAVHTVQGLKIVNLMGHNSGGFVMVTCTMNHGPRQYVRITLGELSNWLTAAQKATGVTVKLPTVTPRRVQSVFSGMTAAHAT